MEMIDDIGNCWNLDLIDMDSEAFGQGCDDAQFKRGFNGNLFGDDGAFADYCCGYDMVLELKLREAIDAAD